MKKYSSIYSLFICVALVLFISSNSQAQVKSKPKSAPVRSFCSSEQPAKTGISKDTTRAMADNYFIWDNGKVINVKIISGGSPLLRKKIIAAAKEWEKYANLTFNFVDYGDAQIRILLTDNGGCNSVVGTQALSKSPDEKTMNIDTNFFYSKGICYDNYLIQTIQHEFGHAIGLLHEHSYKGKIQWNKEVVYKEAWDRCKWDKQMVDFQIFEQYEALYTNGFQYDQLSIMHYGYPAKWTANNVEIKSNFKISEGDKATVAFLYPKAKPRENEFPRFAITNYAATKVVKSDERKGLIIYPSFNLSTSGRTAKIIIVAYLLTAENKTITSKANPENIVADYRGGDLKPGLAFGINKATKPDFELFIPYSEIPAGLTNYKIFVQVRLYDDLNKETKYLAQDFIVYNSFK